MRYFVSAGGLLLGLLGLLGAPAAAWACRVCRPRVQAAIHGPDYAQNLLVLLLPVALLLAVGLAVYFAADWRGRYQRYSAAAYEPR